MNGARGEAALKGRTRSYRLCLTLGALAELETVFGVTTLGDLATRFRQLAAADMALVLAALLRGGGEDEAAQCISALDVPATEIARAITDAFSRGFA
jgi:hypothetical protein